MARAIQGITPYIEELYGRQKAIAIAQRYNSIRYKLGLDVCAMLDNHETLVKRGVIEAPDDAPTALETATCLMTYATMPTPSVSLLRAIWRLNYAS